MHGFSSRSSRLAVRILEAFILPATGGQKFYHGARQHPTPSPVPLYEACKKNIVHSSEVKARVDVVERVYPLHISVVTG